MAGVKRKTSGWSWLRARRLALLALASAVVSVLVVWLRLERERRQGMAELSAVVAGLDADEPGWRWGDIVAAQEPIRDDENSALVIEKVVAAWGKWSPSRAKLPDGRGPLDDRPAPNVRLDAERLKLVRDDQADLGDAVALAVSLKDHPRGRTPIRLSDDLIGTLLPHAVPLRSIAGLLELDCELLLHDGQPGKVPDRLCAILRTGAALRDDPILICGLIRFAIRGVCLRTLERCLAMGEFTDRDCRTMAELLQAEAQENVLLGCMRGDRAGFHHLFENLRSGRVSVGGLTGEEPGAWGRFWSGAYAHRLPEDQAFLLAKMTDLCELARLPVERQWEAWGAFDQDLRASRDDAKVSSRRIVSHLLMPAANKVGEASLRDHAHIRCAVAGLAAERFRLANGRLPVSLEELCPEYLPAVPLDPFDGRPMRFAKTDDGIVTYSVGKDGIDGGGDFDRNADVGFRLYAADKRNLPARAE